MISEVWNLLFQGSRFRFRVSFQGSNCRKPSLYQTTFPKQPKGCAQDHAGGTAGSLGPLVDLGSWI